MGVTKTGQPPLQLHPHVGLHQKMVPRPTEPGEMTLGDIKTGLLVTHLMLHFQFLMQKEKGHWHVKPSAHHIWSRWLPLTLCQVKGVQQVTAGS